MKHAALLCLSCAGIPTSLYFNQCIQPGQNRCSGILRPLHIVYAQQPCMSQFRCSAVQGIGREACERLYFNQQRSCASLHSHKLLYTHTTVLMKGHGINKHMRRRSKRSLTMLASLFFHRVREPQISQALHVVSSVLCDALHVVSSVLCDASDRA